MPLFNRIATASRVGKHIALIALAGALLAAPATGQTTIEERLARICEQLESQRQAHHVPGCAIAIVKDGEVILARGFGARDLENSLPATEETLFAIGSTTKAMTATLIGMLMDEGRMSWDDHPRKFLPWFRLSDPTADEQVTIRDMLCHRVGLASNDVLWFAGGASREEILRTVGSAQLLHPFREKFNYNNVMYLAAGEAAARAADAENGSWDALIQKRIFAPLGMTHSTTSIRAVEGNPQLSRGYEWDKEKNVHTHKPMRNLDSIAPAGSVNSCATDMAQWVKFLLARGVVKSGENEQRLVGAERIEETWAPQIKMSGDTDYGLGWMIRTWRGKRLIEHSGGIDGFGAHVALLPDEPGGGIGFALLTNVTASPLQPMAVEIVFDGLLGDLKQGEPQLDLAQVQPYLGKYHFDMLKVDVTVLIQNGKLAVDVPGQMVFELKPPDAQGKWVFAITDQIAVSFVRDDADDVVAMKIYQAGLEFELPREGVERPIEISLADARKYLGTYHSAEMNADLKVLHRNGRLALDVPRQMIYDLHLPDDQGRWAFRAKKSIQVRFNENDSGEVESMTMFQEGHEMQMPRIELPPAEQLPSVDEVLSLHAKGHGTAKLDAIKSIRMSGSLRFVHQGALGTITIVAQGMDRFVQRLDLGKFGHIETGANGDRAWSDTSFAPFEELSGDYLQQTRLQHPLVIASNWRQFFNTIDVERVDTIDDQKVYVLTLTMGDDVTCTSFINADSGLVMKDEVAILHRNAGRIKTTFTYGDYRDVEGVMLPMRLSIANEFNGEAIATIDTIEVNVDLPPDTFEPKRSTGE